MNLRNISRVARWEVSRQATGVDRRTVALVLLVVLLSAGVVTVGGDPTQVDNSLYVVGATEESQYVPPLEQYGPTSVVILDSEQQGVDYIESGAIDAYISPSGELIERDSEKGRAAVSATKSAVERYNAQQLQAESDQAAAYPVVVSVSYIEQRSNAISQQAAGGNGAVVTEETIEIAEEEADALAEEPFTGTLPTELAPPFPFDALIYAFLFLIPMNFIVQSFASSIIDERLNRRGELLLVTPLSEADIVIGKMLPYLGTLLVFIIGVSIAIGVGPAPVIAVFPLALAYLGAGFLAGVFSRSYQELTFVVLSASLFFTAFAFIPAIFTSVNPIAVISPLSIVVKQIENDPVLFSELAFSSLPLLLSGVLMIVLGLGIYTEESLFTQRAVPAKMIDSLATQLHSWKTPFVISALSIPFVFAAELLVIAGLFVVPQALSIPILLALLAIVEEIAKSIAIYAGFRRRVFSDTRRLAIYAGIASGFGFFVAEKLFALSQTVGLMNLPLGQAAFESSLVAGGTETTLAIVVLVLFPIIHSLATVLSALGARRGFVGYLVGLTGAIVVHVTYNLMVVSLSV